MKHDYRQIERTWPRAFRCRCRRCEARLTLERRPDQYTRKLECWSCGFVTPLREDTWRVDWFRTSGKESRKRGVCHCRAAPSPSPRPRLEARGGGSGMRVNA